MDKSWNQYYKNTKSLKPSKFLIEALETFKPATGSALDIGCGAGRDTKFLLERSYEVEAVDKDPEVINHLKLLPHQDKLKFTCSDFSEFKFGQYEIVNAHYSLPFVSQANFNNVIDKVVLSVKPGGLFVGQLFGLDDEWNTVNTNKSFCTRKEVERIFKDFEKLQILEVNEKGLMANGNSKHWHVYHIVAKK